MSTKRHRKVIRDSIQGITSGDFRRLFAVSLAESEIGHTVRKQKPGEKLKVRMTRDCLPELRSILKVELDNLLSKAANLVEYNKRKSVMASDIEYAAKVLGSPAYFPDEEPETIKNMKELRKKAKKSTDGYLVMARTPFVRFMREVLQDHGPHGMDLRISKKAVGHARFYMERKLKDVFVRAIENMITLSTRVTLTPVDIMRARNTLCKP